MYYIIQHHHARMYYVMQMENEITEPSRITNQKKKIIILFPKIMSCFIKLS